MYVISIQTTEEGDKLLGTKTSANPEKQLGIFVGNRLISAPSSNPESPE
jgi:preprotein translocase subunit SecD